MNQTPTLTEKRNAMISYCFLAPLMLLSRQEQFKSDFVRSHARYATLIHIGFLVLIVSFVRSRNFSSTILYDITWVHGLLFVLFFILLFLLGNGLNSALKWGKPKIALNAFSIKSLEKEFSAEITVTVEEKTPLILSHIPFLWIYLTAKHGGKFAEGEKFGNWLFLFLMFAIWIDPSMTLFITTIILVIFWLVYQWVWTEKDTTVHLFGSRFWNGQKVHVYTKSIMRYIHDIFRYEKNMPSFSHIFEETKNNYSIRVQEKCSPFIYIPILNIVHIFRSRKDESIRISVLQWSIVTLMCLYWIIVGNFVIISLCIFAGFWTYNQCAFQKDTYMPIIGECADGIMALIQWKKEKSIIRETHLITHQ